MVKRCIGIDVGPSYLCAVQVLRIGKAFCVEKVFDTQARRDTDSASETLRTLVGKHGFDRRAAVSISLPGEAVFFRSVETDSVGLEQVREAGYSIFENDFPIEADELVTQPCSYRQTADDRYCILSAAASRKSLREMRDIVLGARMQPSMIGAAAFSIHSTVALNHPEIRTGVAIIAHIAESCLTLALTENNRILIVRHFPIESGPGEDGDSVEDRVGGVLLREAGITWRKLFDTEIAQDTRIYLAGAGEDAAGLREIIEENLHCQTAVVNPYARVLLKHVGRSSVDISVAEGLALRTLAPEYTSGINFLEAGGAGARSETSFRKEMAICAALVVAIAAVSLAGLFMRRSQLEGRYDRLRTEINAAFRSAMPQETNIVDPLAQLEQKLQLLEKDYALFGSLAGAAAGPLDILSAITANTPEDMNISLDDMLITAESVRLAGTTKSFDSVYKWQRLLEKSPQFSAVDVGDTNAIEGERVSFIVLASFAAGGQQ